MLNAVQIHQQLQRAQGLAQSGRMSEAWDVIAPLRAGINRHGGALRLFALIAQNAGKADAAIDALRQICAVEGEPPEILGALADTLDQAGQHSEAYKHWSRLVKKQPGAVDAHLNRSITADRAGRFDEAIEAAEAGLLVAPGHARLLAARALALTHADRMPEALSAYEAAVTANPLRAQTRYNQAIALRMACRFDESCEAYDEAERLGMSGTKFQSHRAAAELEAGRVDVAADRYRAVLAEKPTNDEARRALTRIELEYRDGSCAFDHYAGLARRTNRAADWADFQLALLSNKRFEEAGAVGREAMAVIGREPAIYRGTLFAEGISGDAAAALDEMERLPPSLLNDDMGLIARAQLALRAHRPEVCVRHCEIYNERQPVEQTGWTLLSLAWRALDDPREHWLCDYDQLVMPVDVPSDDGKHAPEDYARIVAAALDPLHTSIAEPGDQSLRNGTQTSGMLFARLDPAIQQLRRSVLQAAERAVAQLPDDPAHPFLKRKARKFDFNGSWSVRLRGGGGHHIPHFHGYGWMSSAYYARLPASDDKARSRHEGWIEFGRSPAMFRLDFQPRRVVEPQMGRLVLFPSYLWHGTVPFEEGQGDRLTAAFDYLPVT